MRGFIRIAFTMWVCAALGQAFTLLAFFNGLEETRQAEVVRHLETMVGRVLGPASARAALGFPVEFDSRFQKLVDSVSESGKEVDTAMFIVDAQGVIVFSSDQAMVGAAAPAAWTGRNQIIGNSWVITNDDETVVGAAITNGFSAKVGTIVARSPRRNLAVDAVSTLRFPAVIGVVFVALAAVQAVVGVMLVCRPLLRLLSEMVARYQEANSGMAQTIPPDLEGATAGIKAIREAAIALFNVEEEGRAVDSVISPTPLEGRGAS